MASRPLYSVSFLGSTKNYYVVVSADPGESLRQYGELIEDFKAQGLTIGNYCISIFEILEVSQLASPRISEETSPSYQRLVQAGGLLLLATRMASRNLDAFSLLLQALLFRLLYLDHQWVRNT